MAFKLTWERGMYTPIMLKREKSMKDIRKEFTRLRDVARKRLKRLEDAGLDETPFIKRFKSEFKKLSELKSDESIRAHLISMVYFIESPQSFVSTARKRKVKIVKDFVDSGWETVNLENVDMVLDFLDAVRNTAVDGKKVGSPPAMDFLEQVMTKKKAVSELVEEYLEWESSGLSLGEWFMDTQE